MISPGSRFMTINGIFVEILAPKARKDMFTSLWLCFVSVADAAELEARGHHARCAQTPARNVLFKSTFSKRAICINYNDLSLDIFALVCLRCVRNVIVDQYIDCIQVFEQSFFNQSTKIFALLLLKCKLLSGLKTGWFNQYNPHFCIQCPLL